METTTDSDSMTFALTGLHPSELIHLAKELDPKDSRTIRESYEVLLKQERSFQPRILFKVAEASGRFMLARYLTAKFGLQFICQHLEKDHG